MLQRGAFCNFSTCIKLPFVIQIFVLSIFERPFYTGFQFFGAVFASKGYPFKNIFYCTSQNMSSVEVVTDAFRAQIDQQQIFRVHCIILLSLHSRTITTINYKKRYPEQFIVLELFQPTKAQPRDSKYSTFW